MTNNQTSLSPEEIEKAVAWARACIQTEEHIKPIRETMVRSPAQQISDESSKNTVAMAHAFLYLHSQLEALKSNPSVTEIKELLNELEWDVSHIVKAQCDAWQPHDTPIPLEQANAERDLRRSKIESALNGLMCGVALLQGAKSQLTKEVENLQEENAALVKERDASRTMSSLYKYALKSWRRRAIHFTPDPYDHRR